MDWQIFFLITKTKCYINSKFNCSCKKKRVEKWHKNHEFGKEYLGSDMMIANVYFTGNKDAEESIRSLNDLDKSNLNMRLSSLKVPISGDSTCFLGF